MQRQCHAHRPPESSVLIGRTSHAVCRPTWAPNGNMHACMHATRPQPRATLPHPDTLVCHSLALQVGQCVVSQACLLESLAKGSHLMQYKQHTGYVQGNSDANWCLPQPPQCPCKTSCAARLVARYTSYVDILPVLFKGRGRGLGAKAARTFGQPCRRHPREFVPHLGSHLSLTFVISPKAPSLLILSNFRLDSDRERRAQPRHWPESSRAFESKQGIRHPLSFSTEGKTHKLKGRPLSRAAQGHRSSREKSTTCPRPPPLPATLSDPGSEQELAVSLSLPSGGPVLVGPQTGLPASPQHEKAGSDMSGPPLWEGGCRRLLGVPEAPSTGGADCPRCGLPTVPPSEWRLCSSWS